MKAQRLKPGCSLSIEFLTFCGGGENEDTGYWVFFCTCKKYTVCCILFRRLGLEAVTFFEQGYNPQSFKVSKIL